MFARPVGPTRARIGPIGLRCVLAASLAFAGSLAVASPSLAGPNGVGSCLWLKSLTSSPNQAATSAGHLVSEMTLAEKVAFLGLSPVPSKRIEEENVGVPRLCIPSLILRDGPVGVAAGSTGVTAFPSELSLAATFDPTLALQYGLSLGREARGQGTMGIQGPGLNVSVFDNWGRGFENLGEDPTLTSVLGSQLVVGIQRTGEFAMAKHLGAYVQETGRQSVNVVVSPRAEQEIYVAPFRSAVKSRVGSIMCAMGHTNGVEDCSNADAIAELRQDGFAGFVRTDAGASTNEVAALESGVDLFRPYDPAPIQAALANDTLPVSIIDQAVRQVIAVMLRYGDVLPPTSPNAARRVTNPASVATSVAVAERSTVLLKNNGVLPLATHGTSIAVIGAAAQAAPILSGGGSSQVQDVAPTTDLTGILALGAHEPVTYTPAASSVGLAPLALGPVSEDPTLPGYQEAPLLLPPTTSGLVDFSYASVNPVRLDLDGTTLLQNVTTSAGGPITYEKAVELSDSTHDVSVEWQDGSPAPTVTAQPVDSLITQAAAAAQSASTAIVVVGERDSEGVDRSSLALPGYQDQLIEAVAAANPRTIVVVNSGGPVLMPWLGSVAAVVEAWYPGQVAGTALDAVLAGAVNPSGRLPVAFPTSDATAPLIPAPPWPNPNPAADLVALGDLGVGSRWYEAHDVAPLFPFGYGLSYSTFTLGPLASQVANGIVTVRVPVSNAGPRKGRYVALADVTYPSGSGEPADELKAFGSVTLLPHRSTTLSLEIPISSLDVWQGSWELLKGSYTISVGSRTTSITIG
jgi:beta-glucosidase